MAPPKISYSEAERTVAAVNEAISENYPYPSGSGRGHRSAIGVAAERLSFDLSTMRNRLRRASQEYGLEPDPSLAPKPFEIDPIPDDGHLPAEELIAVIKARQAKAQAADEARELYQVRVKIDGPIGVVFFGDPHIDTPSHDMIALERDVLAVRDTPGALAVNVGDTSDNWVGRLGRLYVDHTNDRKDIKNLILWLFGSLPWLATIGGNHDAWHGDVHDAIALLHEMATGGGLYQSAGVRMQLNLPGGAFARVHVRHDFPGRSQFNPAHAMVRETLFGFRDHILACGHRHQSGHCAVWHNDPKRLCQGFRTGSYKRQDAYAFEKGFKPENWAPAMMAVIDPDHAADPVRYVRACYSVEEGCEYLTWRREKWALGKRAAA